jgi:hypothetical protein
VKRRSPWLTFAACALAGASCLAQPAKAASVNLEQALAAAKSEIRARANGTEYTIESIQAVRKDGQLSHYVVQTYPPLRSKDDAASWVALTIDATGKVADAKLDENRRRIRVVDKQ